MLLKYTNNNAQYILFSILLFSLSNTSKNFCFVFFFFGFLPKGLSEERLLFDDLHVVLAYCTDNKQDAKFNFASASSHLSLEKTGMLLKTLELYRTGSWGR